ncbi:DNA-processing protein DprA [Vagococcus fessus]|nr:DNA-processing protein DprA [Vagococcus fessus]
MCDVKFMFFKLKHCRGISNKELVFLFEKREEFNLTSLSPMGLADLIGIKGGKLERFLTSYQQIVEHPVTWSDYYKRTPFLFILDNDYPDYLKEIYNPPIGLFYRGNIGLLQTSCIAVVGSRTASFYGRDVIKEIVPGLVRKGLTIVSGLASGIDTAAHQETIYNKGKTIGIIGCGLDRIYPKEGKHLQNYMAKNHLVLSEYPEGTPPLPYHFPERNRLIAGLSLGTCVIEAKVRSGSLITASLSLEMGREVFAVPGSILGLESIGCLKLIQEGAKCVTCSTDILDELIYKI